MSVHTPLTEATRGLIDAAAFATMKPEAVLLSVSRAEIVDEAALYEALSTRAIAGAESTSRCGPRSLSRGWARRKFTS